jgi:hypothetical protein
MILRPVTHAVNSDDVILTHGYCNRPWDVGCRAGLADRVLTRRLSGLWSWWHRRLAGAARGFGLGLGLVLWSWWHRRLACAAGEAGGFGSGSKSPDGADRLAQARTPVPPRPQDPGRTGETPVPPRPKTTRITCESVDAAPDAFGAVTSSAAPDVFVVLWDRRARRAGIPRQVYSGCYQAPPPRWRVPAELDRVGYAEGFQAVPQEAQGEPA